MVASGPAAAWAACTKFVQLAQKTQSNKRVADVRPPFFFVLLHASLRSIVLRPPSHLY